MMDFSLTQQRLHNQHLSRQTFVRPAEVVCWLGAVQAQDYAAAQWAVGLRLPAVTARDVQQAFDEGTILRTHVMRPTWHFVVPKDIRWLLNLTAPRVKATLAYYDHLLGLDKAVLARSSAVLAGALQGGKQLTRAELTRALQAAGVAADNTQRFGHLIMHAELDGLICSGARRGKQFTYALLDERVPPGRLLTREEALAELARRYFTGHGPATLRDFAWWSGLTITDARAGLEAVKAQLVQEERAGQDYWFAASSAFQENVSPIAHLLPNYDEYLVGYADRNAVFDTTHLDKLDSRANILFHHVLLWQGRVVGTWARELRKNTVTLALKPFARLDETARHTFAEAAGNYAAFLGMSLEMTVEEPD